MSLISESDINIIAEDTRIEGKAVFDRVTRIFGSLSGDVHSRPGSELILGETGTIEGNVHADTFMIDGFVRGDITAKTRVVVSRTGRVVGNIRTPSLVMEFGAYFEGRCLMETDAASATNPSGPSPQPV